MPDGIDILQHPVIFSQPRRLTDVRSWHLHIPFAFLLMDLHRPRTFVELGTHKGDSYCAFCQAVDELGLETKCTAVDHWKGDDQTGNYGEDVLEDLRNYHDPLYGRFSRLLRSTFDEAVKEFPDGSIDLLHLDGHHRYESVRHDFESWRSKLSDRAVVLFHDTGVRKPDFGVWKLWDELRQEFPGVELPYGNGLGVLAIGPSQKTPFLNLLYGLRETPERFHQLFARLGIASFYLGVRSQDIARAQDDMINAVTEWTMLPKAREKIVQIEDAIARKDANIEDLTKTLGERDAKVGELAKTIEERDAKVGELAKTIEERNAKVGELGAAVKQRDAKIGDLTRTLEERDTALRDLGNTIKERDEILKKRGLIIEESEKRIKDLDRAYLDAMTSIQAILKSRTWRWSWPMRYFIGLFSK